VNATRVLLGLTVIAWPALALADEPEKKPDAPPAAEAPPPAAPAPAAPAPMGQDHQQLLDAYSARAEQLQAMVSELEKHVLALRESAVFGSIRTTRGLITHVNEVQAGFVIDAYVYVLDGKEIANKYNLASGPPQPKELDLVSSQLSPGTHTLQVSMTYVVTGGAAGVGAAALVKGTPVKVESKYDFDVPEGRLTKVRAVGYSKDDLSIRPDKRLTLRFDRDVALVSEDVTNKP
jgi:hypothetical protein